MEGWNHISWMWKNISIFYIAIPTNSEFGSEYAKQFIVISTFNCLCYGIEPRVNKDISFNLLENMLTLFTTVRYFSYAKDIKEKH